MISDSQRPAIGGDQPPPLTVPMPLPLPLEPLPLPDPELPETKPLPELEPLFVCDPAELGGGASVCEPPPVDPVAEL
jgi:hypothetical protein